MYETLLRKATLQQQASAATTVVESERAGKIRKAQEWPKALPVVQAPWEIEATVQLGMRRRRRGAYSRRRRWQRSAFQPPCVIQCRWSWVPIMCCMGDESRKRAARARKSPKNVCGTSSGGVVNTDGTTSSDGRHDRRNTVG